MIEITDETIVSMVEHNGTIYVATQHKVYRLIDDVFVPLRFKEVVECLSE
jgi:hypothetical protein